MRTRLMLSPRARPGRGGAPVRTLRRWWRRVALAVVPAVAGGIGIAYVGVPAFAVTPMLTIGSGVGSCPAGYVCLWTLSDYTGAGYAFYNSETDYATLPAPFSSIENFSWSFYNNGTSSDIMFFRDRLYLGDWFVLCRQTGIPVLPSNSDLPRVGKPPGAETEPGRGWRDQISSHHFGAWC
jgi:hypothetical protein